MPTNERGHRRYSVASNRGADVMCDHGRIVHHRRPSDAYLQSLYPIPNALVSDVELIRAQHLDLPGFESWELDVELHDVLDRLRHEWRPDRKVWLVERRHAIRSEIAQRRRAAVRR